MGGPLVVSEILDRCPKLVQLDITLTPGWSVTFDMHDNRVYPTLRRLEVAYDSANSHIVPPLLQYFPGLQLLRLTSFMIGYEYLNTVLHAYSNMQQLVLGPISGIPHTESALFEQGHTEGIRSLFIQSSWLQGDLIAEFLIQHATTVESVQVLIPGTSITYISTFLADPVVFERLHSLRYLCDLQRNEVRLTEWIISHAPNIELVEAIEGGVNGRTLPALIGRPVKRINLEFSASSATTVGQYEFLDHHVALGVRSSLQYIKCTIGGAFTSSRDWLHLISKLQQLSSLEICLQYGSDTSSLIDLLQRVSNGCPSLKDVTLTFLSLLPHGFWIHPLSQHPRLKSLVIVSDRIAADMLPTLEHFRHLELLHLKLKSYDGKAIARLKTIMPCLVCAI